MKLKVLSFLLIVVCSVSCAQVSSETTKTNEIDEKFRRRFPYKIEGVTYDGGPVLTIPYGDWDIPKAIRQGEKDKLRDLYFEIFDKISAMSKSGDGKVKSGIVIFDMKRYSLMQGFNPEANAFMVEMTNYFETKYGDKILKRWYLINTPPPFQVAYNLLKIFLPENTQQKWKVYGQIRSMWQWQIFKDVSPEILPQQYGGVKDV